MKIFLLLILFIAVNLSAESDKEDNIKLPDSGIVASTNNPARNSGSTEATWGDQSLNSEKGSAPITGSISKLSGNTWKWKLSNSSEDQYTVTVSIIQYNSEGKKMKSNSYSVSLTGKESMERELRTSPTTYSCDLKVSRWNKKVKPKSTEEIKSEIEKTQEKIKALQSQLGES